MKPASAKQKGSRLERRCASDLRSKGLDKNAKRMPLSGGFSHLKGDIYTSLPVHFECKNQERVQFWKFWEQCEQQCPMAQTPILVISGNYRPIRVVMRWEDYLNYEIAMRQYD